MGAILRNGKGEKYKLCVGCGRQLSLQYPMSECALCLLMRDEGGG